jgi:L-fuconolactonase
MFLVDAQIHLFAANAQKRANRIGQATLSAAEVIEQMDAADVDRAYLVPVGSAANEVCLAAAGEWPDRFRVIGIPKLNDPDGREQVSTWRADGFAGARVSFPPFRDPSWLCDGTADWFWPAAEIAGIPVTMWAPNQFAEIADIAMSHPQLRLCVDHLNLFVEDKGASAVGAVVERLLPLSEHPNIAVKASALPAHSRESFPYRDVHGPLKDVLDAFGADRVFWGTDLTRLPCNLGDAVRMFTDGLGFLDEAQLERVMGTAIVDWMGW